MTLPNTPRDRAEAVRAAMVDAACEQVRSLRRLVLNGPPGLIRNRHGEVVGVDVWVRLYEDGREVLIDRHRRVVNPPTVVVDEHGARHDPVAAFWSILWDSIDSAPNPTGWRRTGTVTTIFAATTDGQISSASSSYATARAGTGTLTVDTTTTSITVGQQNASGTFTIRQGFLEFDTSAIPDTDHILDIDLAVFVTAVTNTTDVDFMVEARESDWGGTLTTADWVAGADLAGLPLLARDSNRRLVTGAYNSLPRQGPFLTVAGLATGTVRLMLSSHLQRQNRSPGTGGTQNVTFASADASGTTQDPRLTITHQANVGVVFVGSTTVLEANVGVEPEGVQEGDLLIAVTTNDGGVLAAPSGWTQVGQTRTGGGFVTTGQVWSIRRGVSPPALTWTGSLDFPSVTVFAYRHVDEIVAVATSAANSSVAPSVTATDDDQVLVCLLADSSWGAFEGAIPAGMVDRSPLIDEVDAEILSMAVLGADERLTTAGATGTRAFTTLDNLAVWSVILAPVITENELIDYNSSGGLVVGGEAAVEVDTHTLISHTGTGGLVYGGEATVERNANLIDHIATGGVALGGDSVLHIWAPQVASDIVVEVDWDRDGNFDEDVEDITDRVLALDTLNGRDFPSLLNGQASPGWLRCTLNNDDSRFSYFNKHSPLWSGSNSLDTGAKIRVRAKESTTSPDPVLLSRDRFPTEGPLEEDELGNSWTVELGTFETFEGAVTDLADFGDTSAAVLDLGVVDYYAQVQLWQTALPTENLQGHRMGITYRWVDQSNYSLAILDVDQNEVQLIDVVNGVEALVDAAPVEVYEEMHLGVHVSGSTATLLVAGVPVASGTAPNASATKVGLWSQRGDDVGLLLPPPVFADWYVWTGLPAEVEGVLWTGELETVTSEVHAGPLRVARLEARGVLSRTTAQVDPPTSVQGRPTGLLVGQTLAMARLLHPPGPIDKGDLTTGPVTMGRQSGLEALRKLEEAELGFLFETQEGHIGFESRKARDGAVVQAHFTDGPGTQLGFHRLEPLDWRREIINRAEAELAGEFPSGFSRTVVQHTPFNSSHPLKVTPPVAGAGDLLIMCAAAGLSELGDVVQWSVPDGWVDLTQQPLEATGAASLGRVFVKRATSTDQSPNEVTIAETTSTADGTAVVHVLRFTRWFGELSGVHVVPSVNDFQPPVILLPWAPRPTTVVAVHLGVSTPGWGPDEAEPLGGPPIGYSDFAAHVANAGTSPVIRSTGVATALKNIVATLEQADEFQPGASGSEFMGSTIQCTAIAIRGPDGDPPGSGVLITLDDLASQDKHGVRTKRGRPPRLFDTSTDASTWASEVLDRYATDRPVVRMSFYATKSAAYRLQAIGRRVGDRIHVTATGESGMGIDEDFFIEAINHRWSHGRTLWEVTWDLSPAPT